MLRRMLTPLRLPSQCLVCHRWPAEPVCAPCVTRFARARWRCERCALPVPDGVARCGACVARPPPLDRCMAAVDYAFPWSPLLSRLKFAPDPGLAAPLAALWGALPDAPALVNAADWVLPMPLAPQRLAERGFNQSLMLARALPGLANAKLKAEWLWRPVHRAPQSALSREDRLRNMAGVFAVRPKARERLSGTTVLLVDDVMTTGASVYAAADALRRAGVARVTALVVARTP